MDYGGHLRPFRWVSLRPGTIKEDVVGEEYGPPGAFSDPRDASRA